jgi:stage III sporulation protein AG
MLKNTILNLFKTKKIYIFAALIFVGVIIIIIGKNDTTKNGDIKNSIENLDPSQYSEMLEERVEELCNRVDGVSGAYAIVTLKGGYQAIYAIDSQSGNTSTKNQTVVIGSGSGEKAILEGYSYPEIAGIGIVCHGGDSYEVKNKIVSLISSAFDISANKIFVVGS